MNQLIKVYKYKILKKLKLKQFKQLQQKKIAKF